MQLKDNLKQRSSPSPCQIDNLPLAARCDTSLHCVARAQDTDALNSGDRSLGTQQFAFSARQDDGQAPS